MRLDAAANGHAILRDSVRVTFAHRSIEARRSPSAESRPATAVTYCFVDGPTIATLIVAGATLLLALATFRLGTRAAEETRAQWRPVLLVRARRNPEDQKLHVDKASVAVEVENVGRGPALDVTVRRTESPRAHQRISALAPQETAEVTVPIFGDETVVGLSLAYADLSKAGYGTSIFVGVDDRPELLMQSFESRPPLTFWWTAVVPRRLRRRLWPIVRWNMRRRGYLVP